MVLRSLAAVRGPVLVGTGIRFALLLSGSGDQRFLFVDSPGYLHVASAMPSVLWNPGRAVIDDSLYRTPGYPLLIWAIGGAAYLSWAIVAQCLLGGCANVWLTHRLAQRVASGRAAAAAAWIVALDPASVGHALLVATETLTTTCLLVSLLLLAHLWPTIGSARTSSVRRPRCLAVATGLAFGLTALVRPSMAPLTFGVAAGIWAVGRSRRALALAALVALAALGFGGWYVRNVQVAGVHSLATVSGMNLLDFGVTAAVVDRHGWSTLGHPTLLGRLQFEEAQRDGAPVPRFTDRSSEGIDDSADRATGIRLLRAHPGGAAVVAAHSLGRTVIAPGTTIFEPHLPRGVWRIVRLPLTVLAVAWIAAFDVAFVLAAARALRRRARHLLAFTAVPVAFVLLSAVAPVEYLRFRVPVVPCAAILVGWWISEQTRTSGAARRGS